MDGYDYFQITALVVFYVIFLGRALQLFMRGTNPFALGIGKKGLRAALEVAFMAGLVIWTVELVSRSLRLGFSFFPEALHVPLAESAILKMPGVVMISVGLLVFLLSLVSFGESWRIGIDTTGPGELVTGGIFSVTRNPIFLFLDMYLIGTWFIYCDVFFGLVAFAAITGCHWQILQEEKFLSDRYGKPYQDYKKHVGRYFSFCCFPPGS